MSCVQNVTQFVLFILLLAGFSSSFYLKISCTKPDVVWSGDSVTVRCDITHHVDTLKVRFNNTNFTFARETNSSGAMSVGFTDHEVALTINNVSLCNEGEYRLFLSGKDGFQDHTFYLTVGNATIYEKESELICTVYSSQPVKIVWSAANVSNHPNSTMILPLKRGYMMTSTIKLSDVEKNNTVCCSANNDINFKEKCLNISKDVLVMLSTSEKMKGDYNKVAIVTPIVIGVLVVVGLLLVYTYLLMRRKKNRTRERGFSESSLTGRMETEEFMDDPSNIDLSQEDP
ncbi:CD276 antigen-like [Pelobates cultripes]|uniref:CD276 antigen-like n=1 Tax=Pelobates cultripes TaxID=61616 RepID=A0AAD1S8I1_PELCU|nr:CD276 antigen-like [Pelobates cultripes]